jgi:hypothetical protein
MGLEDPCGDVLIALVMYKDYGTMISYLWLVCYPLDPEE